MKLLLLFVFFSGVVLVIINELLAARDCSPEYRYLPRDLDDYLREAPFPSQEYAPLFRDNEVSRTTTAA